jgi:hypothetical protein
LEARFADETDEAKKRHTLLALDRLVPSTPIGASFFERILQSEQDEVLRIVAAIAVLMRQGRSTATEIISMLIRTSILLDTNPNHRYETWSLDARFYPGPWHNDRAKDIADAFATLGLPEGAQVLMTALARITNSDVAHIFVERLLDLVFSGKQIDAIATSSRTKIQYLIRQQITPRDRDMLDAHQRAALIIIVNHTHFWEIESNLLELYGIPSSRNTLYEWLSAN